jgi:hypothetical protein
MYMPAKKTATNAPSKSDFVRSQPATLSASEVVAKAKEAGLKLTSQLVYKVRSGGQAKGKAKKAAAAKKPVAAKPVAAKKPAGAKKAVATKTAAPTKETSVPVKAPKSKAAFVRGLSASTPAKDVVKQAKALGLSLSINYVYNIRGAAKTAAKKKRAGATSAAVSAGTNGGGVRPSASAENLLKAVGAEIGLGAAIAILSGERARVRAVLGG